MSNTTISRTTKGILAVCRDLGVDAGSATEVVRTYAGRDQRAGGAMVWFLTETGSSHDIGSRWSATAVIKAHRCGGVEVQREFATGFVYLELTAETLQLDASQLSADGL